MRFSATYELRDLPDDADQNEVCERGARALADVGLRVGSQSISGFASPHTVVGLVKGQPEKRWREVVMAESVEEAEAKAAAMAPKGQERSVAASLRGEVPVGGVE